MARTRILTLSALAAVLGACSALAGPGPAAEVAPVVVWAQAAVGGPSDSADTDFRSRFGLFADQSESTAAWPGPAWDRSGAPAASERSGEAADGDSQSSRAAQLASYVTHLTEQGFSSGDQLSFDQTPTPSDQTSTPSERNQQAEAEQRGDAGGEPGGQDQGPADGRASDAEEGSSSGGHSARLALLRQRRKKLRLSAARDPARLSVIRRRQKPAAAEKSEEPATDSTSDQQGTEAKDSAAEAPRLRRPFGLRRRRPVHSPSHQRRRRPTQQSTTETSATPARRPSRRRRPTRPPTSTARPTEEPADAGTEETVYYKPSAEEYPDYPPFAPPREPTQAPQPPLRAPQLASPGSIDTAQAAQQPSSDSLQQFSDQRGPPNGGESDTEQNLTDKVTKLKQKLAEEKEQNENELSSEGVAKPIVPSLPAEQVTTRPLRELFDVLTKAELARGPRRENYGPAAIENGREPPRQSVAASIRRPNVQRFQATRPQVQGGRQSASPAFQGPRPQSVQASSERAVPSEVVYESGFKPITDTSRFSAPQSQPSAGPQASAAPPQPPQSQRVVSGTFVSGERRPTQVPSRPTFAAPQQRPSVVHTVRRPGGPPTPAPAPEKKATSGGKIRFPGADESTSHQQSSVLPRPPPSFGQRPRPGQEPARPGSLPPFGANPSEDVRRPGSPPDQRPFPGFPPRQHLGAAPTQFPSGPKNTGHPRPPTGPVQQHFGVQQPGGSPRPSGDGGQRPSTSHLPDSPRPFGGAHRFAGGSVQSRPGAISGSTPFPPFQGRPIGPPVHRNQNRPPPFSTQSTERTPPQSFGGLPEPPFRRPRPGPPQRRPVPKGRPQGPPFNQLTSGPPSKDRTRFPPSPSGPSSDGRLPLQTHPDNRQEASQVTEKSVQEQRPSPPPRPPRPSASFGLQRPPGDFQQRPPPNGFQQRPPNGFQQRPPNNFQQRPNGLQRRPTSDFQQRPPNDFQQRPPSDFQQRPHNQFEQNPSERPPRGPAGQRRPPTGQRRPPFGFQQRPSETDEQTRAPPRARPSGAPDQDRHPVEFQQRPSESSPDGPRPRPELQRRPPPGFRRPPPTGFQSRPPPGFRPGPGQFGQRLPARPGSGLPPSAHPRRPSSSDGPLADLLTRRRDQQVPGQLLLHRG
ncbi:basic proline-rich protein-like [Amphibalanus amphitrite]|uniref:basic proline-rich protein-like n=1 Tax=Amphibalanus amphitrite TaxID=1232801 RepID=UPI001C8FCD31|nr:basic proline-rich protein-like [Amphibalanus amphitrite]